MYKPLSGPNLDYGEVINDKHNSATVFAMIESVQHNTALVIARAIKGASRQELHEELGFDSLRDRKRLFIRCYHYNRQIVLQTRPFRKPNYFRSIVNKDDLVLA